PLLPAGLRVTTTMINRLPHANTMPVAGVVQRPVTKKLYLDFTTAALRHRVAFFHRRERCGADDGHPVSACAKRLLRERFTSIGDLPVSNDDFVRALFAQGFHRAKPFV